MVAFLPCVFLMVSSIGQDATPTNPLLHELLQKGVMVNQHGVPLPPPRMKDGLDQAAQTAIIKEVIGEEYAYEEFTRRSPLAPMVLRHRDVEAKEANVPVRGIDVVFLAYGDIQTMASQSFLDRSMDLNKDGGKGRGLEAKDLAKRKITIAEADADHEGYAYLVLPLLDKVEIRTVGRGYWSQSSESVIAASKVDERFQDDAEFPNQWRPIRKQPGGERELGAPKAYAGGAYYVKATRLHQPAGALFVEAHIVYVEPVEWFNGANLLRSKLGPVIQSQVRTFRRELAKGK